MSEIIKADDKAAAVFNMYRYPLSIAGMLYLSEIMAEVYLDVVVLSQMLAQTDYPQDPVVMARHIETAILIKKMRPVWKREHDRENRAKKRQRIIEKAAIVAMIPKAEVELAGIS